MRLRHALAAAGLFGATACSDILNVEPVDQLPREQAITGATSARASVLGIYDALQSTSYYGGQFILLPDVSSDDVDWTGTFTSYADAEVNSLQADNSAVTGIYQSMYRAIARANLAIRQLPGLPGLAAAEKNQLLGEAYFLRALIYHDAVRLFGGTAPGDLGVPLILQPIDDPGSAPPALRATVGAVYAQILSDLTAAESRITAATSPPTRATTGAVRALRARVEFYRGNYATAEALASTVIGMGYALAGSHQELFTAEGTPTSEDIFKITFSAADASVIGYYYLGRYENAPSIALLQAFDPAVDPNDPFGTYNPDDERGQSDIFVDSDQYLYGLKFPTTGGAEDFPVIRLAEMYLIRAESRARQGNLIGAAQDINVIRARAGAPLIPAVGLTQAQLIDAAIHEFRLEFAMEGQRWFHLRRTGRIMAFLAAQGAEAGQDRYPIPQSEINVVPGLQQNPGY